MNDISAPSGTRGGIDTYVAAVRAALADLPAGTRDELVRDLPDHLAEVAAEHTGPLDDRLGPPARYAAELRAAAGLPEPRGAVAAPAPVPLPTRLNHGLGRLIGYETFGRFAADLRPAWWVLRGSLAEVLLAALLIGAWPDAGRLMYLSGPVSVFRYLLAAMAVALPFTLAGVLVSVRLGRARLDAGQRTVVALVGLVLVGVAIYSVWPLAVAVLRRGAVPELLYWIFG